MIAENEFGLGIPNETKAIKISEVPQPPNDIYLDNITDASVLVSWTKPEFDGGSPVTSYIVEFKKRGTEQWVVASSSKLLKYTVTKLIKNQVYNFRVRAQVIFLP